MQAKASSRIAWYSTSVSVWAGATVMESPVCTPIGSKFSMEQTTTQLSARVAHDLELELLPAGDRLLDQDLADRAGGQALGGQLRRSAPRSSAMPVPAPPRMKLGRTMIGKPIASRDRHRLVEGVGEARRGHLEADLLHGRLEPVAVLGGGDGLGVGPDDLDAEAFEHAPLDQLPWSG